VLLRQRLAGLWFAAGVVVGLVPLSIVNLTQGTCWKPWPPDMAALTRIQAFYASYSVRYDTVYLPGRAPQQFFCNPAMAQTVGDHVGKTSNNADRVSHRTVCLIRISYWGTLAR
jgi:hypothetical protein